MKYLLILEISLFEVRDREPVTTLEKSVAEAFGQPLTGYHLRYHAKLNRDSEELIEKLWLDGEEIILEYAGHHIETLQAVYEGEYQPGAVTGEVLQESVEDTKKLVHQLKLNGWRVESEQEFDDKA